jgi:hypothetical protein
MRCPQAAGCDTSAAEGAERRTTEDFISELFYRVDERMKDVATQPQARLWPSEGVTLGVLLALKGVGNRAFSRGVSRDWPSLCPALPERTRLLRLLALHRAWTEEFLAAPAVLGVVDSSGSALLPPLREGRSAQQIGRKGKSKQRWIVGGKLGLLLKQLGVVVAGDCAGAKAPESAFPPRMEAFADAMSILSATAFQAKEGAPPTLKLCNRGTWNPRMLGETVLARLTGGGHLKKVLPRTWAAFQARLAFTLATFNLLVQGQGLKPDAQGLIRLSLAEFSL